MYVIEMLNGIKYLMWILLITWVSLEPNLAKLGEPMTRLNSKVLYSYETEADCEWAKEWVLDNNSNRLIENPTMKAFCVKRRETTEQVPNQEQADRP